MDTCIYWYQHEGLSFLKVNICSNPSAPVGKHFKHIQIRVHETTSGNNPVIELLLLFRDSWTILTNHIRRYAVGLSRSILCTKGFCLW